MAYGTAAVRLTFRGSRSLDWQVSGKFAVAFDSSPRAVLRSRLVSMIYQTTVRLRRRARQSTRYNLHSRRESSGSVWEPTWHHQGDPDDELETSKAAPGLLMVSTQVPPILLPGQTSGIPSKAPFVVIT